MDFEDKVQEVYNQIATMIGYVKKLSDHLFVQAGYMETAQPAQPAQLHRGTGLVSSSSSQPTDGETTISPAIPTDLQEKDQLNRDLTRMGLNNLLALPWSCQSEKMIRELLAEVEPDFPKTIRAQPDFWTVQQVGHAFRVPDSGLKLLNRGDNRLGPYFEGRPDQKEGWV